MVVGAPGTPGIDFRKLQPVIITVCARQDEEETLDDVPIVPRERVIERPLEEHTIEELQAALVC